MRKIAQGKFYPTAIFSVLFVAEPELLIGRQNWTCTYPDAACFSTASSDHHHAKMDDNGSDGRGDGVECTRQAGYPVAREGRMPGMPESSSTSAKPSAAPAGLLSDGVAPNPCPNLGTPFTLPGNRRAAVGAPDARWGGGNTWRPLHFSAIADAMGSGLGSTHDSILSCLRITTCKALLLL